MISCSSAEEMLPSWGVLVSCYFIALRGNKRVFEEKERKWKWQGNNRSISTIFLHQVISRLLCRCLRFKETQGEIKQFTHSPSCCRRLYLNQMVFKAHYRQTMITHAQASIAFLQQHERDHEPTKVLRAGEHQGDLTPASQSSRRASWPSPQGRASQRELPSSHRSFTISAIQDPWEELRPVQSSCSAHGLHTNQVDAVSQLFLVFSSVCPLPQTCLHHLLRSPYSAAVWPQLIFGTSLAFPRTFYCNSTTPLNPRRHNHAWQRWPSHSTTNLILSYSLILKAHNHLASSLQHPEQFLRPVWELFVGKSHSWLTQEQRLNCVLFPKPTAGCKQLYEGREVTEARQPDPPLSCTARQLARVCHTSLICTQRYFI